jgi:hypothetical protein
MGAHNLIMTHSSRLLIIQLLLIIAYIITYLNIPKSHKLTTFEGKLSVSYCSVNSLVSCYNTTTMPPKRTAKAPDINALKEIPGIHDITHLRSRGGVTVDF